MQLVHDCTEQHTSLHLGTKDSAARESAGRKLTLHIHAPYSVRTRWTLPEVNRVFLVTPIILTKGLQGTGMQGPTLGHHKW